MKFGIIVVNTNLYSKCEFMKIAIIFYLRECMNFFLYIPHFLTDLGDIRYIISSHNAIALFWVL